MKFKYKGDEKRKEYNIVKAQLEKISSELFPFSVD